MKQLPWDEWANEERFLVVAVPSKPIAGRTCRIDACKRQAIAGWTTCIHHHQAGFNVRTRTKGQAK